MTRNSVQLTTRGMSTPWCPNNSKSGDGPRRPKRLNISGPPHEFPEIEIMSHRVMQPALEGGAGALPFPYHALRILTILIRACEKKEHSSLSFLLRRPRQRWVTLRARVSGLSGNTTSSLLQGTSTARGEGRLKAQAASAQPTRAHSGKRLGWVIRPGLKFVGDRPASGWLQATVPKNERSFSIAEAGWDQSSSQGILSGCSFRSNILRPAVIG